MTGPTTPIIKALDFMTTLSREEIRNKRAQKYQKVWLIRYGRESSY